MSRSHSPTTPLTLGADDKKLTAWSLDPKPPDAVKPPSPNLRNIFSAGRAPAAQLYAGHPGDGGVPGVKTAIMLERLAVHMQPNWPHAISGPASDENPAIPAGYTYLAQLAAHDLVHNVAPLARLGDVSTFLGRSYRTERLVLETIYGGGPAAGCLPFAREDFRGGPVARKIPSGDHRWRLRLGRIKKNEMDAEPMCDGPLRDIARVACPHLNDAALPSIASDALIADPRNDDHLIISQLAALFHEFHNVVVEKTMTMMRQRHGGAQLDEFAEYRAFLTARQVVALIYRKIVTDDLLEKLLEGSVHRLYNGAAPPLLDDRAHQRVPVEFSHAAYRFGHAMIRARYALNDGRSEPLEVILNRSSSRMAQRLPLAAEWLVDWSRFFVANGKQNHSRRIRPHIGQTVLANDSFFSSPDRYAGGIFYRDFVRGAEARVRTVASLIDVLRLAKRPLSPLLDDADLREDMIRKWLKFQAAALPPIEQRHRMTDEEVCSLSKDPPLLFFVLFEAALDQKGERLGILGSTILAEVFYAGLDATKDAIERDNETVAAAKAIFGEKPPNTMPGLIDFIKRNDGLAP